MIEIDPQLLAEVRDDIPERYAHPVGVSISPSGRYAIVMLLTNEGAAVELDENVAEYVDGEWRGVMSSGGPSAGVYVGDHRAAVLCNSDPLPSDVERVVVADRGHEYEVPVERGYFLYAAWKQDKPGDVSDPPTPTLVTTIPRS